MSYNINTVLKIAQNEIGYLEKNDDRSLDSKAANAGNGNFTKYWRDLNLNMQGQPWCDAFVSWCFMKAYGQKSANEILCGGLKSFYTPTSAQKYKDAGRFSSVPAVGDQIFFKNSSRICHTGIVAAANSKYITTIEGNTSGASGVVPNGGGVKMKVYERNYSGIAGYGHPVYVTEEGVSYPRWVKSGDNWYYRLAEGVNAHGWHAINHHRYYFDKSGRMLTEWNEIDGKWYYFQPESGKGASLAGALYASDQDGAQQILTV